MRVFKTTLLLTVKTGFSVLFGIILVVGVLALDKSFNISSRLTGSSQVAAVSSPPLADKFCDDPASESQSGCTSFIPSVLAAASAPYQDVSGDVNISGNVKFGAGSYLYSSVADNFTLQTGTNNPNPNLTIGYGNGSGAGRIDTSKEYLSMNAGRFMFQNGRVGIRTDNPVAPLTVNGLNNQGIRIEWGNGGRLTFPASNNSNLWNIDNADGKMRFFREDYSASGYGANGVVKMTIDNDGVKFACRQGFWPVADGRICVEQTLRGPSNAWDAIGACRGVGPGSRVCTHNDLQQACGSGVSNPYGAARGWYGDHGVASGGNWDDEYGAWNSNGCTNNNDDPAYHATSMSLPFRCCY